MNQKIKIDKTKFKDDKVNVELIVSVDEFRLVYFYLKKGQKVKSHVSKSHVVLTVLKGKAKFFKGDEENFDILKEGEGIYYPPLAPHGFQALDDTIIQAFISPNPVKKEFVSLENI